MDGRVKNGGARSGAGRKPKADEQTVIERLSIYEDVANEKLRDAVEKGEAWAIKLYFEYRYGKPNQTVNHQNNGGTFDNEPPKWIIADNSIKEVDE